MNKAPAREEHVLSPRAAPFARRLAGTERGGVGLRRVFIAS